MPRTPANLNAAEIALFLDVDGTLLDIAPRPAAVDIAASLVRDLAAVERAVDGALALVSGRPIAQLDRLFTPLRLRASGIHGAEIRHEKESAVESVVPGRLGAGSWRALIRLMREFSGSYGENKGVAFAVHYPDPGTDVARLRDALLRLMARIVGTGRPLRLLAGRGVFEIQLCGFDKGRAIARFMEEKPFAGRMPVFVGDDEIDRAGFDAVLALGGVAFSVGAQLPGLTGAFAGPDAVRAWLRGFAR